MFGYAKISTTELYTRANLLKQVCLATHPGARRNAEAEAKLPATLAASDAEEEETV